MTMTTTMAVMMTIVKVAVRHGVVLTGTVAVMPTVVTK
jgi:hypothetical protein